MDKIFRCTPRPNTHAPCASNRRSLGTSTLLGIIGVLVSGGEGDKMVLGAVTGSASFGIELTMPVAFTRSTNGINCCAASSPRRLLDIATP